MADKMDTQQIPDEADGKIKDMDRYVYNMYEDQITYYRKKASSNRKNYKGYRFFTVLLGSLVTLIASLSISELIKSVGWLGNTFALATPILAFLLTVINTLSQNFQWGATWRDMSINAQRLEKERDRFLATPVGKRNYKHELSVLNTIVLQETQAFFQRILDAEVVPTDTPPPEG